MTAAETVARIAGLREIAERHRRLAVDNADLASEALDQAQELERQLADLSAEATEDEPDRWDPDQRIDAGP